MTDDRPLRIAHLSLSAQPATVGGMETVVDTLIRQQQALGYDVTLVTRWKQLGQFDPEKMGYQGLSLLPNPKFGTIPFEKVGPRWPTALSVGWHQLRRRFDIWHAHWLYPTGWMAEGVLRALGTPVIMTAHGGDVQIDESTGYGFRRFARHDRRLRRMLTRPQTVTGVSQGIVETLLDLGAPRERVSFIPNGVSVGSFQRATSNAQQVRAGLGIDPDARVVLSVARNQPSKGLHHIPAILSRLLTKFPELCWVIAGPGTEDLAPLFAAQGMMDHVRLTGAIRKAQGEPLDGPPAGLIALYRASDLFVFPTHSEAFGLVAIEAMAAGLPVIASDIPGLRDFVIPGRNGLLVPVGDAEAFAAAISRLLLDQGLRETLSAAGQVTARAHDWPAINGRYVGLYRKAIEERRA